MEKDGRHLADILVHTIDIYYTDLWSWCPALGHHDSPIIAALKVKTTIDELYPGSCLNVIIKTLNLAITYKDTPFDFK